MTFPQVSHFLSLSLLQLPMSIGGLDSHDEQTLNLLTQLVTRSSLLISKVRRFRSTGRRTTDTASHDAAFKKAGRGSKPIWHRARKCRSNRLVRLTQPRDCLSWAIRISVEQHIRDPGRKLALITRLLRQSSTGLTGALTPSYTSRISSTNPPLRPMQIILTRTSSNH